MSKNHHEQSDSLKQTSAQQFPLASKALTSSPARVLRLPEVMARVGLKRASIYQHVAAGTFPTQITLGVRAVGWLESEIDAWLSDRVQARPGRKA